MDFLKVDLMPFVIKSLMIGIKKIVICSEFFCVAIIILLWAMGFIGDLETGVIVTVSFQFITINMLILGLKFNRTSQSIVRFTDNKIQVLDRKGKCWREIDYSTITTVRAEIIADFFYGQSKKTFRYKYICLYLNGATSMPNVSFAKLFKEKDFFMFNYKVIIFLMIYIKNIKLKVIRRLSIEQI